MTNLTVIATAANQPRIVMPAFGWVDCAATPVRAHVSALKGATQGTSVWSPPTS